MQSPILRTWLSNCNCLSRVMGGVVSSQYEWLRMQQKIGMRIWTVMLPTGLGHQSSCADRPERTDTLEARALERVRQGFAPPREIYDVQNRGRIDWKSVPEWAKPADPEAFEGCTHEG